MSEKTKSDSSAKAKQALAIRNNYLDKSIVGDFGQFKTYQKLAMLQKMDVKYFKEKSIGSSMVQYLPHQVAEKALNLAFNFNVDVEIIKDGVDTFGTAQKGGIEVTLQVKFTFKDGENTISRAVYSGHKQFRNNALTKADCYKAALSKAYTIVAKTFGIGSVVVSGKKETVTVQAEEQAYEQAEKNEPPEPVEKSFGMNY